MFDDVSDSFSAYYFFNPIQGGKSIAEVRLAKIWDDMQMDFKLDLETLTGEEIVNTEDAILVVSRERVEEVKALVNYLEKKKRKDLL